METLRHVARHALTVALMIAFRDQPLAQLVLGAGLYLASFSFTHDLAHGGLGLSRRANEWLLAFAALPHLISGHSMRLMHQRHHARPTAADDFEGGGAAVSFGQSLAIGPMNAVLVRTRAWAAANAGQRRWIAFEYVLCAAVAALALATGFWIWVAVCAALHLTASAWASHVPHHPPALVEALIPTVLRTRSIALIGFVLHDFHHAHPKLPCRLLAKKYEGLRRQPPA